jgi:hypothetical protein
MEAGRQIDRSDEQDENAESPRCERIEPASNATNERRPQALKQELEMARIDEGMQMR